MGITNGMFDTDLSGWEVLTGSEAVVAWDNGRAFLQKHGGGGPYPDPCYGPKMYQRFLIDNPVISFEWETSWANYPTTPSMAGWYLTVHNVSGEDKIVASKTFPLAGSGMEVVNISEYIGKEATVTFGIPHNGCTSPAYSRNLWIDNVMLSQNWGIFDISSNPSGAEIWIDGDNTGFLTPKIIPEIPPGSHLVVLKKTGYYDYTTTINVVVGRTYVISPTLEMQVGKIIFNSTPAGAKIYLSDKDGNDLKDTGFITPYTVPDLPWGTYKWRLHLDFYKDESGTVDINTREGAAISKILIPSGNISFTTEPAGASITLDGVLQEGLTTPAIIGVAEGWHHYVLTLLNHDPAEGDVYVYLGQTAQVAKTLLPASRGKINFVSTPAGAEIFIDGKDQGIKTPATIIDVPAGNRQYVLKLTGFNDYTGNVLVEENKTAQVSATLVPAEGCVYFSTTPPGARIFIDDIEQAGITTPALICGLTLGPHKYRLVFEGYQDITGNIDLAVGQGVIVTIIFEKKGIGTGAILGLGLLGAGILGAVILRRK